MSLEIFLSIASLTISIGGLVPVFLMKEERKEAVFAVVIAALVVTSTVALYQVYRHEQVIKRTQREILAELEGETLTFDQIYLELHYASFTDVSEALFRAVELDLIQHRMMEFQSSGEVIPVRGYFLSKGG